MTQPTYHLRPHKTVDRNLFCDTLRHYLRTRNVFEYRYIGFGSYEFDDFKLFYRNFGINDMHSIEADSTIYLRQKFNKPYSFVKLFNKKCSDYIDEDFDQEKRCIFWMDFSDATDKVSQFEDVTNLISKCDKGDIIRVTLNAQPTSIVIKKDNNPSVQEKQKERFATIKKELNDVFPFDVNEEWITLKKYPLLLLKILRNAAYKNLSVDLSICPICAYTYADGQQMLTVTMTIIDSESSSSCIETIKESFIDWNDFVNIGSWDNVVNISLPILTIREQLELSQIDYSENEFHNVSERLGIKKNDIESFYRFVRYYPNYQHVVL